MTISFKYLSLCGKKSKKCNTNYKLTVQLCVLRVISAVADSDYVTYISCNKHPRFSNFTICST